MAPGVTQSLSERANRALSIRQYDEAAELFAKDGEETGDANSYYNAGLALSHKMHGDFLVPGKVTKDNTDYLKIVSYYEKALQLSHNSHGRALSNFGKIQMMMKEYDQAESLLKTARGMPPTSSDWLTATLDLGSVFMMTKRAAEAIKVFEEAFQHGHSNEGLHNKAAACYSFTGNTDKAIEQYKLLLKFNPNNATAAKSLNDLLFKQRIAEEKNKQEVNTKIQEQEERIKELEKTMAEAKLKEVEDKVKLLEKQKKEEEDRRIEKEKKEEEQRKKEEAKKEEEERKREETRKRAEELKKRDEEREEAEKKRAEEQEKRQAEIQAHVASEVARGQEKAAKMQAVVEEYKKEIAEIPQRNLPPAEMGAAYTAAAAKMQEGMAAVNREYA